MSKYDFFIIVLYNIFKNISIHEEDKTLEEILKNAYGIKVIDDIDNEVKISNLYVDSVTSADMNKLEEIKAEEAIPVTDFVLYFPFSSV